MSHIKDIIIIGAGPAGLTAAYELLKNSKEYRVTILEDTDEIGGISRTVNYKGNRMDIGGHRFFSKSEKIMNWWTSLLPIQGAASKDDFMLNRGKNLSVGGPDPEVQDRVMLLRDRVSRIYYLRKFYDYPISLKLQTFLNMGIIKTARAGCSYMYSSVFKRKEQSLEDFMVNRFGSALYRMFFENYTQKVWGIHPSKISAEWGAQRIKGLSLCKILIDLLKKPFRIKSDVKQKEVETSLIEQFIYPKYGPGQLWETVADEIKRMGGEILTDCRVIDINMNDTIVTSVSYIHNNRKYSMDCDTLLSSMPIRDLIGGMSGAQIPENVTKIAAGLPYRDFITVGLLVNRLNLKNETKIKTIGDIVPDCWIYIQEPDVKVGRLQIFNNWSPYMVNDFENKVWIGLEYFCNEGDELWNTDDSDFISFAAEELQKIGMINKSDIIDTVRVKVKKAYPAYFGTYEDFDKVRQFLDGFDNLYCIGRNGQHRYNNMDHSMLTAMEAVDNILNHRKDKTNIWSVNTEEQYHEKKTE